MRSVPILGHIWDLESVVLRKGGGCEMGPRSSQRAPRHSSCQSLVPARSPQRWPASAVSRRGLQVCCGLPPAARRTWWPCCIKLGSAEQPSTPLPSSFQPPGQVCVLVGIWASLPPHVVGGPLPEPECLRPSTLFPSRPFPPEVCSHSRVGGAWSSLFSAGRPRCGLLHFQAPIVTSCQR